MRRPSKTEKRHREEDAAEEEEDSAPKRSRSVHVPMTPEDKEVYEGHIQELHDELANEKPSKKRVKRLMQATYTGRRGWIENDLPRVAVVLEKFPPLREHKHVSHLFLIMQVLLPYSTKFHGTKFANLQAFIPTQSCSYKSYIGV